MAKARAIKWDGLTEEAIFLAERRTELLAEKPSLSVQSYRTALANAYLIGVRDAALLDRGRS